MTRGAAWRLISSVSIAESPAFNQDVFEHSPASGSARDNADLLEELLVTGFIRLAKREARPAVRTAPPGARTALTAEKDAQILRNVTAGLKLVPARRIGT